MAGIDWKELEKHLQSVDDKVVLDGLATLKKTTDSKKEKFDEATVKALIPLCIDKLEHHDLEARSYALCIVTQQYCLENEHMAPYINDLCKQLDLPNLLDLQQGSPSSKNYIQLHQSLCTLICELQARDPEKLMGHFKPLANYLTECTGHDNREVATAACDYWARLSMPPVHPQLMDKWVPAILTRLGRLIPALLRCMIYHEDHVKYLESRTRDKAAEPFPDDLEMHANLRNYAALGFEHICGIFQTEATIKFKPYLGKYLGSADWLEVEAALLAMSAFTEAVGMSRDMKDIYPDLIAKLIESYSHPKPLIRSITCFVMQRFINISIRNVKDPFNKMLKHTLALLTDENTEVQEMAIQSLAALLGYANRDITPHVEKISAALQKADDTLVGRARYTYFEAISHLFGRMGTLLEKAQVDPLLTPLISEWKSISLDSMPKDQEQDTTYVVCQPLCVIAMHSKALFADYNDSVYEKVVPYIKNAVNNPSKDKDVQEVTTMRLVANLDLLSAMFVGQGNDLKEKAGSQELLSMALAVLKSPDFKVEVYQSCLAFLGHLLEICPDDVSGRMDEIIDILQKKLESDNNGVRNNVFWCVHFLTKQSEPDKIAKILESKGKIVETLLKNDLEDGVIINAALALTSLFNLFPDDLREVILMPEVFMRLCQLLQRPFPRSTEKVTIYRNFCDAVAANIQKVGKEGWVHFCISAAVLDQSDEELVSKLRVVLRDARSTLGNGPWNKVTQQLGPQLAITLRKRYKMY